MTDDIPVYTAHDIPDLINTLPALFGFMPEDSIVAISTYGPRQRLGFRMRMDMPATEDFGLAAGQIVTHLAKYRMRSRGQVAVAVTVRIPSFGGIGAAEHHSESTETLWALAIGVML